MKSLIFIPKRYSLATSILDGLSVAGSASEIIDPVGLLPGYYKSVNGQIFRLNSYIRNKWAANFDKHVTEALVRQLNIISPDLIVIYNHMNTTSAFLSECKKRKIRIVFLLGDSPLYSDTLPTNLKILEYADTIIVPDTYWKQQLEISGLKNVVYFQYPLPLKIFYKLDESLLSDYPTIDAVYTGNSYNNSWGYKKLKYISHFAHTNLKIFGNATWNKWLNEFPELEGHFINSKYVTENELNRLYNCSKLMPVDGNPGLINGMHIRVAEALSAGVLPIIEWRKDIEDVFANINYLPIIKNYAQIREVVTYYLRNEKARLTAVSEMETIYKEKFPEAEFIQMLVGNL